jgi:hypothetical protein
MMIAQQALEFKKWFRLITVSDRDRLRGRAADRPPVRLSRNCISGGPGIFRARDADRDTRKTA